MLERWTSETILIHMVVHTSFTYIDFFKIFASERERLVRLSHVLHSHTISTSVLSEGGSGPATFREDLSSDVVRFSCKFCEQDCNLT